jgi:hypothetical protein
MTNAPAMRLLEQHVPLSLLWDLLDPAGPRSDEILAIEAAQAFTHLAE